MENRVFLRLCCQREAFWYNVACFFFFKVLCLLWFYFFDWSGLTSLTLNTKLFWSTVTWEQLSWIRQKLLHPVSDKAVKWMVLTCALQKDKYMKTSKVPLHPQSHLWSRVILNKRRKLSLCGILHGIPFFLAVTRIPWSPQESPAPSSRHSTLRWGFPLQTNALALNLPPPASLMPLSILQHEQLYK